jgi:hypothetical protein
MPGRCFCTTLLLAALLCVTMGSLTSQNTPKASPSKETSFTYQAASQLLEQIGSGLTSHNQKTLLGAFDLAKMTNGPLFRMQTSTLLAQTGTIRVHFNLMEVAMEGAQGVASVDIEMEADSRDADGLPLHKQARLRLAAENSSGGWKFVDVQPRSFFSTQQ